MQRGGGGGGARGAAKLNTCVHTHIAPDYLSNTRRVRGAAAVAERLVWV